MGRHRRGAQREVTVADLIDELRRYEPGMRVRLAIQPRLPQEHAIGPVAEADGVVWIGDGGQHGYAPEEVRESLGWL
ncbi:hypothetical protein D0T12_24205 [Actinomadura spongiicola]|uniref:Uncharacterized protein n=1 Tax=Actinomadura spongiicola TaxID=2303421 RepID=A0A372GDP6_9ACTN|nr:hypothetical protein [Actinomadura spongiicola]RFS83249.1 hypothetical protein D0T12_24205 [Actinomadura spongiicola]